MGIKVCFLGYNRDETCLIQAIEAHGFDVTEISGKMDDFSKFDVVVSFGYRHILNDRQLRTLVRPAINLHIAYLPYNRGSHPNFWSWIDGTPAGVTIHEIDSGIDTGSICYQKLMTQNSTMDSFSKTYRLLIEEAECLFIDNVESLLNKTYIPKPQIGDGSYHNVCDLPTWMTSWDMRINDAIRRYNETK
ncbi:MAG: formyltransferase family protein [Halopseudomonas aestusnigri]